MSTEKSRRRRERMRVALPAIIQYRENGEPEWSALTRFEDVSPFGASFIIDHALEPGRLIHLTTQMPRQMRAYDHTAEQYRIWAVVRHLKCLPPDECGGERYVIGVAFVGKHPPLSYVDDPSRLYETSIHQKENEAAQGAPATGEETTADEEGEGPPREDTRAGTRLRLPVDLLLELLDEKGETLAREQTVTENISRLGALVYTTLDVAPGDTVRLTSTRYHLSVTATVLARRVGQDHIPRLHLRFTDRQWPLEGLE